jgi:four helix bundle protein
MQKATVVRTHRDLVVWQKSLDLAVEVHALAAALPPDERYGLQEQLRRAAASIPANIAEGAARAHTREYLQALRIARASAAELDSHLALAERLGYLPRGSVADLTLLPEVGRLLTGLIQALRARQERRTVRGSAART